MQTRTAIAGMLALLSAGFAFYGAREAREAGDNAAAVAQKQILLDASLRRKEEESARKGRQAGELRAQASAAAVPAPVNRPGNADASTLVAGDPKLRVLYLRSYRASLARRFASLYQNFQFTPEQIAKFEDLTTARESERMEIRAAAIAQGLPPLNPGVQVLQKQSIDQYQSAITAAFGTGAAEQVLQVGRNQATQGLVEDVASMVPPGGVPLTSTQNAQILQILADTSLSPSPGGRIDPASIKWDEAYARAAAVLSEPQLQAFNAEAQMWRISEKVAAYYALHPPAK